MVATAVRMMSVCHKVQGTVSVFTYFGTGVPGSNCLWFAQMNQKNQQQGLDFNLHLHTVVKTSVEGQVCMVLPGTYLLTCWKDAGLNNSKLQAYNQNQPQQETGVLLNQLVFELSIFH